MKKILILGGNGFIGRNLCAYLVSKGEKVYSFDMHLPENKIEGVEFIEGDFFDDYTLKKVIHHMDIIFHAISTINPGNSNEKFIMGYERDFIQTIKLCDYIKDTDARLVFLSSGGTVYGNQIIQPITEESVPSPINHYGNIKLCIENTIRTFNYQNRRKMRIARISNPYGPGQDYNKGVGFIDAAIKKTLSGQTLEVWGDGSVIRDYLYIQDLCVMLHALMEYEGETEVFNLSSNVGKSQNEIIEVLREIEPNVNVVYKERRAVDANKIILDNHKILEICDIKLTDINTGIQRYYDYLKHAIKNIRSVK